MCVTRDCEVNAPTSPPVIDYKYCICTLNVILDVQYSYGTTKNRIFFRLPRVYRESCQSPLATTEKRQVSGIHNARNNHDDIRKDAEADVVQSSNLSNWLQWDCRRELRRRRN